MARIQAVRVRDLKDQIGNAGPRPILFCRVCRSEYSANRGDYFMSNPDLVLTCHDAPLCLALRRTVYVQVPR